MIRFVCLYSSRLKRPLYNDHFKMPNRTWPSKKTRFKLLPNLRFFRCREHNYSFQTARPKTVFSNATSIVLFCMIQGLSFAASAPISLESANIKPRDMSSVKLGATFFAQHCMSCHTLKYLRYNQLAKNAGITYEKMPIDKKDWWFGAVPPDLSLITRSKSVDWVYTYLHSFYVDSKRPLGSNNLLVNNSSMPNILLPMQGEQLLRTTALLPKVSGHIQWYDLLQLQKQGSQTQTEFDQNIKDVVNFLYYAGEPNKQARITLGFWVLGVIIVLLVLMILLKKEYWKDIKN